MSEQFGFHQRVGDRAGVDRDKRVVRARTLLMNRARHQFFAGAGLALNQNREVGVGDLADLFN